MVPEYDQEAQLICVGGGSSADVIPSAKIPCIQLCSTPIIVSLNSFAELRRRFWILRGREAVCKHQYNCPEWWKWRSSPVIPKMADLPPSSLQLHHPAFYSTDVDCSGPYLIKIGWRTEKRWGISFKCLTTHAIHLDLLASMDTDSFLMALHCFITRRGKHIKLLSDHDMNSKGGSSELKNAFKSPITTLQTQLASQQIIFQFNPPYAPHLGGSWEG